ncbi:MAG TPA: MFS transporter [Coxiellaceae bacterium]|nr:MFS transporter [Coxiellaceae bacterium]
MASNPVNVRPSNIYIHHSNGLKGWLVCMTGSLFFFYEFMQLNMFNALDPALMEAFNVSGSELSHLWTYYIYANVLFLFVAGLILDRFSTRWIIASALMLSVLCTFFFAMSTELWQAEVCRFVTGIGGAFCLLSNVRLASRWFPPERMALVVAVIVTFAMTGGVTAQIVLTPLTDMLGWRETLLIDAGVGLGMLLLIIFFVRDYPEGYEKEFEAHTAEREGITLLHAIRHVLANTQNWLGGLYTSLINLPIFILGAMWGALYLVQIRHLSRTDSAEVASMIFWGTIVGSLFLGWLSDFIRRRKILMIWGAIFSLVLIFTLMYAPNLSLYTLMAIFFGLGFTTSTQIISYPLIAESNPLSLTGTAEGLASTLIMAGGFVQLLAGYLIELHWSHKTIHHISVYSQNDYQLAMWIMPIGFIGSLIAALVVKETYCRPFEERPT